MGEGAVKVLHCCFRYLPDRGGSETYTTSLIAGLRSLGVESMVACLGAPIGLNHVRNTTVYRLGFVDGAEGGGSDQLLAFGQRFEKVLQEAQPDVVHFHCRTREWSSHTLRRIRTAGIPAVLTYHIGGTSCPRGTLMHFNRELCSGDISASRCFPCKLHQLGVPVVASRLANMLPVGALEFAAPLMPTQRIRTVLELKARVSSDVAARRDFLGLFDRVVALNDWSAQVLAAAGVPSSSITVSRLGTPHPALPPPTHVANEDRPLQGLYAGRIELSKGVGTVLEALMTVPEGTVRVDFVGPGPTDSTDHVLRSLVTTGAAPNARYLGIVQDDQIVDVMSRYDFVLVPSQVPETGPFTVVEALQAGVPVLASDLPGMNEVISNGRNGYLVPHGRVTEWVRAFKSIAAESRRFRGLRSQIPVWSRSMDDVAREMADIYESLRPDFGDRPAVHRQLAS